MALAVASTVVLMRVLMDNKALDTTAGHVAVGWLIVEDVLTTGGQVLEVVKTLQEAGAKVERIVAVIDRLEGARQNIEKEGLVFESLFTSKDLGIG